MISTALTLEDLPPPPPDKTGWPWTQASQPLPQQMPDGSEWPCISIVTPSYNQSEFIEETIRSVLLQGYPNLEYIIIDGGSTDSSIEIIKKYQNYFSYWVSEPDKGPADAINKGWQKTSGEIIAYLNSDDLYLPRALADIAEAFHQNPNTKAICGNELKIDREGFVLAESNQKDVSRLSLLNLNFISQPSTFIKKTLLDSIGGINLSIKYTFDFELWLRVTRSSSIKSIPNLLSVTRWHNDTITRTKRSNIGSELVVVITREMKVYPDGLTSQEKRKILFQVNRLAMDLYGENQKNWQSIKYMLPAFWVSPSLRECYHTIKQFSKILVQSNHLSIEDKYFAQIRSKQVHWSSLIKTR